MVSLQQIPAWNRMVRRMGSDDRYKWRALTGLLLGSTALGVALMSVLSPAAFSSVAPGGGGAAESEEETRRRFGMKDRDGAEASNNAKWRQVQRGRLQEMLEEVRTGDRAAQDRRWWYAMSGAVPEPGQVAREKDRRGTVR